MSAVPNGAELRGERRRIEGLADDLERPQFEVVLDLVRMDLRRHENHGGLLETGDRAEALERRGAVHAGHHDIEEDDLGRESGRFLDRLRSRAAGADPEAPQALERDHLYLADVLLVLDTEDSLQRLRIHEFIGQTSDFRKRSPVVHVPFAAIRRPPGAPRRGVTGRHAAGGGPLWLCTDRIVATRSELVVRVFTSAAETRFESSSPNSSAEKTTTGTDRPSGSLSSPMRSSPAPSGRPGSRSTRSKV